MVEKSCDNKFRVQFLSIKVWYKFVVIVQSSSDLTHRSLITYIGVAGIGHHCLTHPPTPTPPPSPTHTTVSTPTPSPPPLPIWQTTFSKAFSWMNMIELRLKSHWNLFPGVQLTIIQVMAWRRIGTSHYLVQCWPSSLTSICGTRGRWVKVRG